MKLFLSSGLDAFKDYVSVQAYGITKQQAHDNGICVNCKQSVRGKVNNDIDYREYMISGLCPSCFDNITKG